MNLLSLLFSFFMVFGESFYKTASWNMVFGSTSQAVVALCKGLLFLFFYVFIFILDGILSLDPALRPLESPSKFRIMRLFDTYPFLFSDMFLLIIYSLLYCIFILE